MIKLKAELIGIKEPIKIKGTIDKKEAADAMLRKLLQADIKAAQAENEVKTDIEDKEQESLTGIEATKSYLKQIEEDETSIQEIFEFLKDVLELTNAQIKKAKKLIDEEELGSYVYYVVSRLRGVPEEYFDLEQNQEEDVDPKKE